MKGAQCMIRLKLFRTVFLILPVLFALFSSLTRYFMGSESILLSKYFLYTAIFCTVPVFIVTLLITWREIHHKLILQTGVAMTAEIIEIRTFRWTSVGRQNVSQAVYHYHIDGIDRKGAIDFLRSQNDFKIGDKIEIKVNPQVPDRSVVTGRGSVEKRQKKTKRKKV